MPAKRVIVLDRLLAAETHEGEGMPQQVRVVFWADVPAARQPFYANATVLSAWKDATAADVIALQTGVVVEREEILRIPKTATAAQIQSVLQARWQSYQDTITAHNPWTKYGTFLDQNGVWTVTGVT